MTKSALASKKNKSNLSSTTSLKKKMKAEQKLNPFEIRFTKAKHNVINRPVQTEAGKPRCQMKITGSAIEQFLVRR